MRFDFIELRGQTRHDSSLGWFNNPDLPTSSVRKACALL